MINDPARFSRATIASIEQSMYSEEPPSRAVELIQAGGTISTLSEYGLERLLTFLEDLTRRAPLTGPMWSAHREVIEALASDVARELEARSRNGRTP